MNLKQEARLRLNLILRQIETQPQRPDLLPLSDYVDEATFNFLLPKSGWSFAEWRAVNREVARLLREEHGFKVVLVRLALPEYFDFLARYSLKNTPENRAQFVAWQIAPEPKPEPIRD